MGGVFLEAFANRDYEQMEATLAPGVRLRAMLPPGPMDWEGPATVADTIGSIYLLCSGFRAEPADDWSER